jgi:Ca2+-binding RTX toxin-like protein
VVSDPAQPGKTALYVYGTGGSDTILVNPATGAGAAKGWVTVLINGVSRGTFDPTGRIVIHGIAGNETIGVSPQVTTPAFIYGGQGNDVLWGGGGPSVIVGGAGSNNLYGGLGRSVLIAGAGASLLSAGRGDAILVAGTANYDANDAALLAILAEWNSSENYATRAADIQGAGNDPLAQNGPYYLNAATVSSNGRVNHLVTGGGLAMFFRNSRDIVVGKTTAEVMVALK